ncbi:MAG: UvrD-helicase domain-containing protein [Woeseia sp.]
MLDDHRLAASDRSARRDALDIARSYIVQAPAGSGKTELLIQRYLKLLAIVKNPEEVVAITFTRKAAAEMRLRALAALRNATDGKVPDKAHETVTFDAARAVLNRDRELGWSLTEFPHRMRIQTMDGLNAGIARSLPLSSALGGAPTTLADAEMTELYAAAAAATFDWLGSSGAPGRAVERVLKHLDNNTGAYVDHVARMLQKRDQWLTIVGSGALSTDESRVVRDNLERRLCDLITERLGAVRIIIPDDLSGQLARLAAYAGDISRKRNSAHPLAVLAGLGKLPMANPESLANWHGIADLLLTRKGTWRRTVTISDGFPPKDDGEKEEFLELLAKLCDLEELRNRLNEVRMLPPQKFSDEQWEVLRALFNVLPLAVTEMRRLFAERGVADHVEVALAADRALGQADDPGEMALLLDHQINHLLVDEMQDTSIAQYRMLEKLVEGWQQGDGRTLFCVGDPMQSIYRFRDAEVGQFLVATDQGTGGVELRALLIRQNFRSGENLVHWFNETFPRMMPASDDISVGAIAYAESVAVDEHKGEGTTEIHPVFGSSPLLEAELGVSIVRECLAGAERETTAVLVRSRSHLPMLLAGLRQARIEYHAVEIDRLTDLPEIIDILALTRALCHFGDRIAWLGLLRGPWVGLKWRDMHRIVKDDTHGAVWDLLQQEDLISQLGDGPQSRINEFVTTMKPQLGANATQSLRDRVEAAWFALGGPALLNSAEEVEYIYRFLDVLERYETAGTLADSAALESLLDQERVSNSASQSCRLQVLTMHKAKGLEFDHVILYGLGRIPMSGRTSVLSWLSVAGDNEAGNMIISPIGPSSVLESDPLHRFIEFSERQKNDHEQGRLLYVACTRAMQSLHLVGHVELTADGIRTPRAGSLLHRIWPLVHSIFEEKFKAESGSIDVEEQDILVEPTLRRFADPWVLPNAPELPLQRQTSAAVDGSREREIEFYWVGSSARHAGTIVHRWLQKAADGTVELEADKLSGLRAVNERWSHGLGVPSAEIGGVCDRVEMALRGTLNDPRGLWCVYGEGRAELPVTGIVDGRVESVLIDRVRIDDDGGHWIIDYKTSTHEGGDLDGFLDQEEERYRAQLEKYARLYESLVDARVRTALYFPVLQEFREVSRS